MINRNVGNPERALRFVMAVAVIGWVASGERFGTVQGIGVVAAVSLLWNTIFARCYLWKWLNISSCASDCNECSSNGDGPGAS